MIAADFELLCRLLKERSGLLLASDKAYLLESRLLPVVRRRNMKSLDELVALLRSRPEEELVRDVVEAMTTNESSFFRDLKPFDQFRDFILPELMKARAGKRTLRIWSAACSSGQEPYSLAILLSEHKDKLAGWQIEIVATDLSTEILEKAQAGVYTQFEVQRGLPIQLLVKYFRQEGERWRIDPAIAAMVRFRALKTSVLDRIPRVLQPDGYLYLGGAETIIGITDKFQAAPDQRGVYTPALSASAMAKRLAAR